MSEAAAETTASVGATPFATPWARFWAKAFDLSLWSVIVGYALGLAAPDFMSGDEFQGSGGNILSNLIYLPLAFLLDAAVLVAFGTTPGAFVAGFRIETIDHRRLSVKKALWRNLLIYFRGLCVGLPLLSLVTLYNAYRVTAGGKLASWDAELETRPFSFGGGLARTALAALLALGVRVAVYLVIPLNGMSAAASG